MTSTTTPRYDASAAEWVERLLVALRDIYCRRGISVFDADDAVSEFMVTFWRNPERFIFHCATPEELARMVSDRNLKSHNRRQRAQRGEGARAIADGEGGYRTSRTVVNYGHSADMGRLDPNGHFSRSQRSSDPEFEVVFRASDRDAINRAMGDLSETDRSLLTAIYIDGRDRESVRADHGCGPAAFRQREKRARDRFTECFRALSGNGLQQCG